jgi:Holliday junction DNA helicase RuvA
MIGVSGVGPRLAIALLSGVPPAELVESIRQGNVAALCRVPGVGRKTAERLVVDLRDKMEGEGGEPGRPGKGVFGGAAEGESAILSDVLSALVNLGYPPRNAEKALQDARRAAAPGRSRGERAAVSFEGLLRDALRSLSAGR